MYVCCSNRQKAMLCAIALRQFILRLTTVHLKVGAAMSGPYLLLWPLGLLFKILGSLYMKMFENYEKLYL